MVEIVNLNRARKARDASQAKATAKINRVAHGRTRAQRDAAEAELFTKKAEAFAKYSNGADDMDAAAAHASRRRSAADAKRLRSHSRWK